MSGFSLSSMGSSISNALSSLRQDSGAKSDESQQVTLNLDLESYDASSHVVPPKAAVTEPASWADMMDDSDSSDGEWDDGTAAAEQVKQDDPESTEVPPAISRVTSTPIACPPTAAPDTTTPSSVGRRSPGSWAELVRAEQSPPDKAVEKEVQATRVCVVEPSPVSATPELKQGRKLSNTPVRGGFSYAAAVKSTISPSDNQPAQDAASVPTVAPESWEAHEVSECETSKELFVQQSPAEDVDMTPVKAAEHIQKPAKQSFVDKTMSWAQKLSGLKSTPDVSDIGSDPQAEQPVVEPVAVKSQSDDGADTTSSHSSCGESDGSGAPTPEKVSVELKRIDPTCSWADKIRGETVVEASVAERPEVQEGAQPDSTVQLAEPAVQGKPGRNQHKGGAGWTAVEKPAPKSKKDTPPKKWARQNSEQGPRRGTNKPNGKQGTPKAESAPSPAGRPTVVTPGQSISCPLSRVTPTSGSWAAKVKGVTEAPVESEVQPKGTEPVVAAEPEPVESEQLEQPIANEPRIQKKRVAITRPQSQEAPAKAVQFAVETQAAPPAPSSWADRLRDESTKAAPAPTPAPVDTVMADSDAEAETRALCWADKVRGAEPAEAGGLTLADKAKSAAAPPVDWPQPGQTPSPEFGTKRGKPFVASTPEDGKRHKSEEATNPSMKLQFAEGEGEVVLLDPTQGAVWIGSLKVRFNNEKWLTEQFRPFSLSRILERGEGWAVLQFPRTMITRVAEVFDGFKVDNRRIVVRASNKYIPTVA